MNDDGFIECPMCSMAAEYWLVEMRDDGMPYYGWECTGEWEHQGYISIVPKDEAVQG